MKRIHILTIMLLAACTQITPDLVWVTPGEGDSVVGTVELRVEAIDEVPPTNVVFFANEIPVAKVYGDNGVYNATWNSGEMQPGTVTLTAKPYGGTSLMRTIVVANKRVD